MESASAVTPESNARGTLVPTRAPVAGTRKAPVYKTHRLLGPIPALRRDPLGLAAQAAQAVGDVARLEFPFPPFVVHLVSNPEHIQHILVDNHRNYAKQTPVYSALRLILGNGLITSEGDLWRRRRALIQPAFHHQRIQALAELMTQVTEELLDEWRTPISAGQPVDMFAEMSRLTFRIIGLSTISRDLTKESHDVGVALQLVLRGMIERFAQPLPLPMFIPTPHNRRLRRGIEGLNRLVYRLIVERRHMSDAPADLLSMLMQARDEETGEGLSDLALRDELMTVLLAGHETTASALCWTLYLLSLSPLAMEKVGAELNGVLAGRRPTFDDLRSMPYLDRTFKEAMRLYPPIWMTGRAAIGRDVIGEYEIPAGSVVFLSQYATHRDPRIWPNPEAFDPDRFTPEATAARHRLAYFPFSAGTRKCLGDVFASVEARLVLATLLQKIRPELLPFHRVDIEPTITLRPKGGLPMTLRAIEPGGCGRA